jgi:hypothetical protein
MTSWRAAICSMRYSGRWSAYLADSHPGQQPGGGQAAVDDRGGNRGGGDGLAGPAGVLRTDVAVHEEFGRVDVELFADVLADLHQVLATLAAGARFRLVPVFDARQVLGQGLAAGALASKSGFFGEHLFGFHFAGGDVGLQGFLEQVALFRTQRFTLGAKAQAAQVGQFQGQRLDLGFGVLDVGVALGQGGIP